MVHLIKVNHSLVKAEHLKAGNQVPQV